MTDTPRYEDITETTGGRLTGEAAEMMYTRYALAAAAATNRRVLELGCGAGLGLGMIAAVSRLVVGGDYSAALLRSGRAHYGSRVPCVRLSAEALPFRAGAFDLVLCFEASYYIADMELAFDEITRLLGTDGEVRFVNANPERPDFVPSPHSVHYHSADEFRAALSRRGFRVEIEAGFPLRPDRGRSAGLLAWALPVFRRLLTGLGLVPRTLKGRARLKRLMYGRLKAIPAELQRGFAEEASRTAIEPGPVLAWKVVYVRAVRS